MDAVRILCGFVCLIGICGSSVPDSDLLSIANAEVGVRELTGRNDGKRVEAYLACVGLKKGNPYCAAWVSWVYKEAGYAAPRTGWSPDLFPAGKRVLLPKTGDVFGIYVHALGRIGHCGIIEHIRHEYIYCIEANTNVAGSREGDGVYKRVRHLKTISRFADWRKGVKHG